MRAWTCPDPATIPGDGSAALLVHDTATGALVESGPRSGTARMYVCGITPYDATHMGHAATYVAFDLLNRTWRDRGLQVHYVQNITDVDDPLLERAQATGVDWTELAHSQIDLFRSDMHALRVLPPRDYIGAVEAIPLVVDAVHALDGKGLVYRLDEAVEGVEAPDWYFRCAEAPGFNSVAGLDAAEAREIFAERGGDPDQPGKEDPLDCLVWRMNRPGEPEWESTLGGGRPGWHIECAAIAQHYLGTNFDVQGGGSDLSFPHHEMSAAEGYAASGEPFAQAFVHAGMVGLNGEKMSKSKGNLILVSRLLAMGVDAMAIRLTLLSHHYRSDWSWTREDLTHNMNRLELWRRAFGLETAVPVNATLERVRAAMRQDLDAPAALVAIDEWARESLAASATSRTGGEWGAGAPHRTLDVEAPEQMARIADALLGVAVDH